MILAFAAMEPEVAACFGGAPGRAAGVVGGYQLAGADGVLACRTGIGRRAQQVAEAVVGATAPRAVLSVGIAGGLRQGLSAGEVVVCTHVDHESYRRAPECVSVYCDDRLIAEALGAAAAAGLRATAGASLTVDEAAWGPAEKAALHAWKRHDIVEMESFWVGQAASRRGIPFLAVRTVSDTVDHRLHDTGALREDGSLDPDAFQQWASANPGLLDDWKSGVANARLAFANLAAFLTRLLPRLAAGEQAVRTAE